MSRKIILLGERFTATKVGAVEYLALLQGSARMLALNVFLEFTLTGTLEVAEHTTRIGVLFAKMGLEECVRGKAQMY